LEVGNTSSPIVKSEQVPSLLKQALMEVFRYQKSCGISFSYQLHHTKSVEVERLKCLRAFVNIIENARQATGAKGKMWFSSRDIEGTKGSFVEVVFGNSGQQIPEELHEKLFEVFFTHGKRGGTGLGLAICRRVVKAHGGELGCRNVEEGVEFWLQFPAGERDLAERPAFPAMSGEVCANAFKNENESQEQKFSQVLLEKRQLTIDALQTHREKSSDKIKILIFDDDQSYGRSLAAHLIGDREISEFVDVTIELSSERVLDPCPDDKFDLIICDVDLGEDSLNGYEIVRRLRSCGSIAHICMHSNRSLPEDYKMALQAGADAFIPKPMSRVHLIDLLRKALVPALKGAVSSLPSSLVEKPLVVLIEDHVFMRESWQNTLEKECHVMAFESPKGFEQALRRDVSLLSRIHCVVTDFYIEDTIDGGKDEETTLAFAKRFRTLYGRPPLILATLGDLGADVLMHYDGAVAKGAALRAIDSAVHVILPDTKSIKLPAQP
jgi:DNA-binding NarL/FixJ family response regulator